MGGKERAALQPIISLTQADGVQRDLTHLEGILRYSPDIADHMLRYSNVIRFGSTLSAELVELLTLRTAMACNSSYSVAHHTPLALEQGLTKARITALHEWDSATCFDEAERAALLAVDDVVLRGGIESSSLVELQRHFDPRAQVEIAHIATFYRSLSAIVASFGVEIDPEVIQWIGDEWQDGDHE